ncbi:hypothetical protein [Lysinibacillus sp. FSL K6-4013]|uniref:hypothetical protein n=1 Tax=Lysinibacillus sp. FSL K6-4013 TaxID=2921504 RepID=UPI003159A966
MGMINIYRAYQYVDDLKASFGDTIDDYFAIGEKLYNNQRQQIEDSLKDFYMNENTLNGRDIKEKWFPKIDADVFLSHSHKDEKTIIALAGYLYKEFHITSFIDSTVWGYANDLLKMIDNAHCKLEGTTSYDYDKRNYSTSHVHLMLNTALLEVLDETECVIFVETPNSIQSVKETVNKGTYSPWIYSELNLINFLRVRTPKRVLENFQKHANSKEEREILAEGWQIWHDVSTPLEALIPLHANHLNALAACRMHNRQREKKLIAQENLDRLYKMVKREKEIAK